MKTILFLSFIGVCFTFAGCVDLFEKEYWREGNYSVKDNPGLTNCKTLYYDIGKGDGIGRVDYVNQIGTHKNYILVESFKQLKGSEKKYWILDTLQDNQYYNAREIIQGPYSWKEFQKRTMEMGFENTVFYKK